MLGGANAARRRTHVVISERIESQHRHNLLGSGGESVGVRLMRVWPLDPCNRTLSHCTARICCIALRLLCIDILLSTKKARHVHSLSLVIMAFIHALFFL